MEIEGVSRESMRMEVYMDDKQYTLQQIERHLAEIAETCNYLKYFIWGICGWGIIALVKDCLKYFTGG